MTDHLEAHKPQLILAKSGERRKMGGCGSGRWVHAETKPTVESCHSLVVGKWVRDGIIAPITGARFHELE